MTITKTKAQLWISAIILTVAAGIFYPHSLQAAEVKAVVNGSVITSGDVAKRLAFMKLQKQKGASVQTATEQLVDETLKRQEIARVRMSVSKQEVDASFARFAASNKISPQQLSDILGKAGVTAEHFKNFVAVQMSWPRLVNARYGSNNRMSNSDLVARMMQSGQKPVTTEYFLQQVIFVVPASKRNTITKKRQSEAESSRTQFPGCEQSRTFAATMRDVSIRDLGRMLAPELPPEWKPLIEQAKGQTTTTRVTEKGVEYLAICKQRQVSDDVAAEMVFREEDIAKSKEKGAPENENSKKYIEELHKKAQITYR